MASSGHYWATGLTCRWSCLLVGSTGEGSHNLSLNAARHGRRSGLPILSCWDDKCWVGAPAAAEHGHSLGMRPVRGLEQLLCWQGGHGCV